MKHSKVRLPEDVEDCYEVIAEEIVTEEEAILEAFTSLFPKVSNKWNLGFGTLTTVRLDERTQECLLVYCGDRDLDDLYILFQGCLENAIAACGYFENKIHAIGLPLYQASFLHHSKDVKLHKFSYLRYFR